MFFPEVVHRMSFGIHVYSGSEHPVEFKALFNLYFVETIDACFGAQNSATPLPGLKADDGKWQKRGHPDRIVLITLENLESFSRIFEEAGTAPSHSRLPQIHGRQILAVLQKISKAGSRLGLLNGGYHPTEMFHEANAQRDGCITRCERPSHTANSIQELVYSGPIIHIATPWSKQARTTCRQKADYDAIDLTEIPDNFFPRTVYRPGNAQGNLAAFFNGIGEWPEPCLPGFWPVPEDERDIWAALCGEKLRFYAMDRSLPWGAMAREFAYFSEAQGPVLEAIAFLKWKSPKMCRRWWRRFTGTIRRRSMTHRRAGGAKKSG